MEYYQKQSDIRDILESLRQEINDINEKLLDSLKRKESVICNRRIC